MGVTHYTAKRAAALGDATTETIFKEAANSSNLCQAKMIGSGAWNGKPFRIIVAGKATGGTTTNLTINLYAGNSATVASNTLLATTGAIAINNASGSFNLIFDGTADSTSTLIQGLQRGYVNGTAKAAAIHSNAYTWDPSAATAASFVVTALFSATGTNNAATLTTFEVQKQ